MATEPRCGASFQSSNIEGASLHASWRGHLPETQQILLPILLRASAGAEEFSPCERILYTVCEFWAAIAARDLATALGADCILHLQDAMIALSTIGALDQLIGRYATDCRIVRTIAST